LNLTNRIASYAFGNHFIIAVIIKRQPFTNKAKQRCHNFKAKKNATKESYNRLKIADNWKVNFRLASRNTDVFYKKPLFFNCLQFK